jgi:hypothetical protein
VPLTVQTAGDVLLMVTLKPPALVLPRSTDGVVLEISGNAGITTLGTEWVAVAVGVKVAVGVEVEVAVLVSVGVSVDVYVDVTVAV